MVGGNGRGAHAATLGHVHGREQGVVMEGIGIGMLGAAAVALWFLVVDTIMGQPLHTPALLGAVVSGVADPIAASEAPDRMRFVLLYTLLHVGAFALLGVIATMLVHRARRTPSLLALLLLLFAAVEVAFTAFVAALEVGALGDVAWYQVAAGNVVAALTMGYLLRRKHPELATGFGGSWSDEAG